MQTKIYKNENGAFMIIIIKLTMIGASFAHIHRCTKRISEYMYSREIWWALVNHCLMPKRTKQIPNVLPHIHLHDSQFLHKTLFVSQNSKTILLYSLRKIAMFKICLKLPTALNFLKTQLISFRFTEWWSSNVSALFSAIDTFDQYSNY